MVVKQQPGNDHVVSIQRIAWSFNVIENKSHFLQLYLLLGQQSIKGRNISPFTLLTFWLIKLQAY